MNKYFYKLLLRSFDSTLNEKEQRRLDGMLDGSEDMRKARQEITRMRDALRSDESFSFKPSFVERTLNRLRVAQESLGDFYLQIFRPIAVGAAILVILLTSYNMARARTVTFESAIGIQRPSLEQALTLEEPFE
jgi:hypothetical protein